MNAARGPGIRRGGGDRGHRPVAVVWADEHDVRVGQPACRRDEVLDALLGRDPADVEHHRRPVRHDPGQRIGISRRGRLREGIAAEADAGRIDAAGDDVVPLPRRRDDHELGARRDAAGERRVERPLEPHLPQARPEHAHRLEDVGDPPRPARAGDDRRQRVAEPDHVRHRRARQLPQREREGGRHAHPAVAERRCEVGHPGAVEQLDPRSPVRASADLRERRRQHLELVAAFDEARDEPTGDLDRAAERVRGPVGRDREEDPKPPVHAGTQRGVRLAWAVQITGPQANPRPEPVLLARDRGDGAAARAALRGARRGLRRHRRHGRASGHELPAEEVRNGVQIVRVRSTTYDRCKAPSPRRELRVAISVGRCSTRCGESVRTSFCA